jgi:aspartate carbamoyltransferase catalytic subunit
MSSNAAHEFSHQHLLGIESLSKEEIVSVLNLAENYLEKNRQTDKKHPILKGLTQINLFFENSTRTRSSFELAGKRLGADVINMSVSNSATKKGETLIDTAMTLNAMQPDFIVVRHDESGAVQLLAEQVNCAVINAGDGSHEHPTQALLDALAIRRSKGSIEGLTIAICGDILHSRVARSNLLLLKRMGVRVRLIAPPPLMPSHPDTFGVEIYTNMEEGIKDCDIIMMLRLQTERMSSHFVPSIREYFTFYGLDEAKLALAKPDALVMHPGPINRGVEIDTEIADDIERSIILDQVEIGVAIRQAVLELLAHSNKKL